MAVTRSQVVAIFDNHQKADTALAQVHAMGVPDDHILRFEKLWGRKLYDALTRQTPQVEKLQQDLERQGLSQDEIEYYKQEFEKDHAVVIVEQPGRHFQEVVNALVKNGAFGCSLPAQHPEDNSEGQVTPGMRPDDNSQTGIAWNANGEPSAQFDEATIEADVEHAQHLLHQQKER